MNKQKLTSIIMIPVVIVALFVAWKSYKSSLPDTSSAKPVTAAGGPGGGGPGGGGGRQRAPTPEQVVDTMAKDLTLTADQKAKVLTIEQDLAAKRKALPKEMSRDDRRKASAANRAAAETKIKTILTADQAKKYEEMQAKRRAEMASRRQQGGGGAPGSAGGGKGGPPMMPKPGQKAGA